VVQSSIANINERAKTLFEQKKFKQALDLLNIPDLPTELVPNLAKCYYYTKQADKAVKLLSSLPKDQNLNIDLALYYNSLGHFDKALEIYESLDQNDPRVLFNKGWHYLHNNHFTLGFEHLQHGASCNAWGHEYIHLKNGTLKSHKRWDGSSKVKHLVYILEGGLGDEIIFLRWAHYLQSFCEQLTVVCSQSLLRLFTNAGYSCQPSYLLPNLNYDAYCPAMSVPAICKSIRSPTDHVSFPYISSFSERYITQQLDDLAGSRKKIGVRFYGNLEFEHDQFRSPPRDALESLSQYGQLFSLQLEEQNNHIPNCNSLIKDWQDTYSVFKGLDILVTSCTSTAHLAGAINLKTVVLVPLVSYFVWTSDCLKWYSDNVTIIRQTKYNDWSETINQLHLIMSAI
jgi:tetratricopeptide (TPR) repeat protein